MFSDYGYIKIYIHKILKYLIIKNYFFSYLIRDVIDSRHVCLNKIFRYFWFKNDFTSLFIENLIKDYILFSVFKKLQSYMF